MWPDNETDRDFLKFEGVADTIAEMIVRADDRPVSIGVSGDWGVGKSSMIQLTKASLRKHQPKNAPEKYLLVEFNAWLYQGYDDARAALLEVIASKLNAEAAARKTGIAKAGEFLRRVKWFRLAKLLALPAASLALGLLFSDVERMARHVRNRPSADCTLLTRSEAVIAINLVAVAGVGRSMWLPFLHRQCLRIDRIGRVAAVRVMERNPLLRKAGRQSQASARAPYWSSPDTRSIALAGIEENPSVRVGPHQPNAFEAGGPIIHRILGQHQCVVFHAVDRDPPLPLMLAESRRIVHASKGWPVTQ